jgi:hypothetical protein
MDISAWEEQAIFILKIQTQMCVFTTFQVSDIQSLCIVLDLTGVKKY